MVQKCLTLFLREGSPRLLLILLKVFLASISLRKRLRHLSAHVCDSLVLEPFDVGIGLVIHIPCNYGCYLFAKWMSPCLVVIKFCCHTLPCHRPSCRTRFASCDIPSQSPTFHRVSFFEPSLSLFLILLVDQLFPRSRWFLNNEEYSCRVSNAGPDTLGRTSSNCLYLFFQALGMKAGISSNKMLRLVRV